jgi:tetratricopeptide (TPR) repeat protein
MHPSPRATAVCLGLVALTLIAYGSLFSGAEHEFVNFDDYQYVRDNPHVHAGLTPASVWWATTSLAANNWHPLTWMSLQLDWQIWGNRPRGFLLTNVLLHAANAVLLFVLLRRLTGAFWPAAAVAAFFVVHPLHVESVAWVTERKDVLSTLFWLLTMFAYVYYTERPRLGRYLLVLLCLTLGLMSKPMLVTLPCVLLLLDWWPLRRFSFSPPPLTTDHSPLTTDHSPLTTRWLLLEKVPFIALVAVACVLTIRAQGGLIGSAQEAVPLRLRVLNAMVSYVAYLRQMVWPNDLAILYLHPMENMSFIGALAAGALLACVTLTAVCWRRSKPYFLLGWLWYLGTLVPVIGLLQVGQQARADRYTYIPLIGIFLALCWGASVWLGVRRAGRLTLAATAMALLVACIVVTWSQLKYWRNSTTLWDRALQVSADDPHMHAVAVAQCLHEGELDDALKRAQTFCTLYPDSWRSHYFLGIALSRLGRLDEARQSLELGLVLEPNAVAVHKELARVLLQLGKLDEARRSLERGLALEPESVAMHKELAGIFWAQERIPAAYEHYAAVARLQPHSAEGQNYRGIMLQRQGKIEEAIHCFEEAVRLAPRGVLHHVDLALALEDKGETAAAISVYRDALDIDPRWPDYCDRLARILATDPDASRRDGKEAIRRARAACSGYWCVRGREYPPFLTTLASAYAEASQFDQAVKTAEHARELAMKAGDRGLADRLTAALQRYNNGQPCRGRIGK